MCYEEEHKPSPEELRLEEKIRKLHIEAKRVARNPFGADSAESSRNYDIAEDPGSTEYKERYSFLD